MLKLQCNIFIYFNLIFCPQLMLRKSLKTNKNPIIFNFKLSIKEFSFILYFTRIEADAGRTITTYANPYHFLKFIISVPVQIRFFSDVAKLSF